MFQGTYEGGDGPEDAIPEYTMNPEDARMEKAEGMQFEHVEAGAFDDDAHLWKQEGDRMHLRTQEEYEADMAKEKAGRKKTRDEKKAQESKQEEL